MGSSATILVVDDQPLIVKVIVTHLSKAGFKSVVGTSDPTAVISLASSERPSLILLDILMPEMGGLEVLEQLKSDPLLEGIPVLMVTSSGSSEEKQSAIQLGAVGIFPKPIRGETLVARVCTLLSLVHDSTRFEPLPTQRF